MKGCVEHVDSSPCAVVADAGAVMLSASSGSPLFCILLLQTTLFLRELAGRPSAMFLM